MATILVIDDEAVIRESIAACLRGQGHRVTCACDGQDALSCVKSKTPDLILLDMRMPTMDGISFLRELRGAACMAAVPVLLLSNATDKELILQAAKLGVQGYILKSTFSVSELLERVERICRPAQPKEQVSSTSPGSAPEGARASGNPSASRPSAANDVSPILPLASPPGPSKDSWPKILTRDETLARLDQVAGGKTVAGVVAQLIAVANSSNADLADVVRVIQSDPILAARLLQLANSASTGSRGRVRSVEEAARNLGVRSIQNMAISIGIFGAFPPDEKDGFNTMRCWQHSYAVAELFNVLVRERDPEQEGMNHLVGLCHDLGEILLRQHFTEEYGQVLAFAVAHELPVHQVESVALGIRHPELISRLLTRIGLPTSAVQGIREFHERQIRDQAAGLSIHTQSLVWANLAAHGLLLAATTHEVVRPITRSEWSQFNPGRASPALDAAGKRNDIITATNVLARLPGQEERRLIAQPIPRHAKRVCYVRPESFIEFDPLAFALSLCCDLSMAGDLPQDKMWQDLDALIVTGIRPGAQGIVPAELSKRAAAAGRPDLSILCLVAQEMPAGVTGKVLLRSYPISLEDIDRWLGGLSR